MATTIPKDKLKLIRQRTFEELDRANYSKSSRPDNTTLIENMLQNPEIGGIIGQYYSKERIRTYIKDSLLNLYAKRQKKSQRPTQDMLMKFCAQKYLVGNFATVPSGDKEVQLLKAAQSPIYVLIVEGTLLKWESALRKGLLYAAAHPLGHNAQNTVHILLSIFMGGVPMTPSDKKVLGLALSRAGADAYFWGE